MVYILRPLPYQWSSVSTIHWQFSKALEPLEMDFVLYSAEVDRQELWSKLIDIF